MYVDDSPPVRADDNRGHLLHVTGQRDEVHTVITQRGQDRVGERPFVRKLLPAQMNGGESVGPGDAENQRNSGGRDIPLLDSRQDRPEVRSGPGTKYGDTQHAKNYDKFQRNSRRGPRAAPEGWSCSCGLKESYHSLIGVQHGPDADRDGHHPLFMTDRKPGHKRLSRAFRHSGHD